MCGMIDRHTAAPSHYEDDFQDTLKVPTQRTSLPRLWKKDPTVWKSDPIPTENSIVGVPLALSAVHRSASWR